MNDNLPPSGQRPIHHIIARIANWKAEAFSTRELYEDCETLIEAYDAKCAENAELKAELEQLKKDFNNPGEWQCMNCGSVELYNTKAVNLLFERDNLRAELLAAKGALKSAEGYMFTACQPSQGPLFGEFDDKNREAISRIDNFLAGKQPPTKEEER